MTKGPAPTDRASLVERQVRGRALKESTAASYRNIRGPQLAPLLDVPLVTIDRAMVAAWYRQLDADTPTRRAHAYALFRWPT